jgi:hypothetical protein
MQLRKTCQDTLEDAPLCLSRQRRPGQIEEICGEELIDEDVILNSVD